MGIQGISGDKNLSGQLEVEGMVSSVETFGELSSRQFYIQTRDGRWGRNEGKGLGKVTRTAATLAHITLCRNACQCVGFHLGLLREANLLLKSLLPNVAHGLASWSEQMKSFENGNFRDLLCL